MSWLGRNRMRMVLAGFATLLSLGVAEIGARIYYFATYREALRELSSSYQMPAKGAVATLGDILRVSPDPKILLEMKPGLDVRFTGVRLVTNSAGWREKELTPKDADTFRIVGLGDSFMFGWGVAENERYMDLLESRLNQELRGRRFETFVFAAPSYNLAMEVEVLRRYALAADPDLIVYAYYENDHCLPNFLAPRRSLLSRESFLAPYLTGTMASWQSSLLSRDDVVGTPFDSFEANYCTPGSVQPEYAELVGRENFARSLLELRDLAGSVGAPLVLLKHLPCERFDARPVPDGIEYIELDADYARELEMQGEYEIQRSPLVISEADPHPSRQGHEVIANGLLGELARRNLLASSDDRSQQSPP